MSSEPDQNKRLVKETRQAELATSEDGSILGACIYLTSSELEGLGINLEDRNTLKYGVDRGSEEIIIRSDI